jgi:hypothetical protein
VECIFELWFGFGLQKSCGFGFVLFKTAGRILLLISYKQNILPPVVLLLCLLKCTGSTPIGD